MENFVSKSDQFDRFLEVIEYLKKKGFKQKDIAQKIDVDIYFFSHLKKGTIKEIRTEILNNLKKEYNINPKYITHGASNMFDIAKLKYENFDSFVDSWDLVEHENDHYLHFTMDENFYKFLISIYNFKIASSSDNDAQKLAEAFEKAQESLQENYPLINTPKEYVLIPVDAMIAIATDAIAKEKKLGEVTDLLKYSVPKNKINIPKDNTNN